MPPKKVAKRKAKAKAKVGSKKRPREEEDQLPDLEDAAKELPMEKEAPVDEDDVPLIDMMPPKIKAKTGEESEDEAGVSESLPSFTAATKESSAKEMEEDDMPVITSAKLGPQGDTTEGDVWQQLEKELQAPLHVTMPEDAEDTNEKTKLGFEEDSDDDWGIKWKGGSELPAITDVLEEIRKQATSSTWHNEEWVKKEEPRGGVDDDDEDQSAFGEADDPNRMEAYEMPKDKKTKADNWQPDQGWNSENVFINSKEAMAVENVVRKIRSRAGSATEQVSGIEPFPNKTMLQVLTNWVKRSLPEQRVLLAAVLLVEAHTLDMEVPMPDLNSVGITMLATEEKLDEMRAACKIAPPHVMLRKADALIPDLKLRKEIAPEMLTQLKKKLSSVIAGCDVDIGEDDLGNNVDESFVDQPTTVRIMGLVHCCEYWHMMKRGFDNKGDLLESLSKQTLDHRVFEVLCRLDLRDAVRLAKQTLNDNVEPLRNSKIACLNRLASEWVVAPREEDMMLVHMLGLERQIQVLLSIERDIELKWCDLMSKVDGREERSAKLREFLNFSERLRPYLNDVDLLPGKRPIEKESGQKLAINELAMVRQGVSDIFKKLKRMYKWKPDINSRKAISKTNWVARLSAVLQLAKTTYTLSADKELRKFLQMESSRTLGMEIFKTYTQWKKMEQGDGVQRPRRRVASKAAIEERQRRFQELLLKQYPDEQQPRFQPQTPAGLGMAAMTPGLGASMTPGLAASMTPGLNPGTPGLSGTITPGFRAPTPMWQSSFTPAYKENSEGNTPQWRPASTPLGPYAFNSFTPGTPLYQQGPGTPVRTNPRTPVPQTPLGGVKPDTFPGTPLGVPPMTPSGAFGGHGQPMPMTPPQNKVKNAKEE